jgi:hypothetical protein
MTLFFEIAQNNFCIKKTWRIRNRIRKKFLYETGAQMGWIDDKSYPPTAAVQLDLIGWVLTLR